MEKKPNRLRLYGIALPLLIVAILLNACQLGLGFSPATPDSESSEESSAPADPYIPLVKNGVSNYVIRYDDDKGKVAAYTLREVIAAETGVSLSVEHSDNAQPNEKNVFIRSARENDVGNYGYKLEANNSSLNISAASLAGYDMAVSRLMDDCLDGKTLIVDIDYNVLKSQSWASNYVLNGQDYSPYYNAGTFYNDKNDSVAYVSNAMWHMFGLVDDGQKLVYTFGNEPTYFEWISEKVAWSNGTDYTTSLKNKIKNYPITQTGFVWAWSGSPYWKVDDCYSIHYDGTFRYISAVYDVISWEGNTNFLYEVDADTSTYKYASMDASKGKTILQKTEAAMKYILEYLYGKNGYIRLTKESTYLNASGSERFDYVFDTGEYCWNNTGKDGSKASNYWDNLCFGNYDGYENALFYNSLNAMAGIYRMLGGSYISKAEEMEALAVTVKQKFNELYWSSEKGRYIACIDTNGKKVDYGLTFHNFEIMKYGLADESKAKLIFDWIDGDRIIAGESRTGKDILSYAKIMELVNSSTAAEIKRMELRLAAVTNTIAINNATNQQKGVAWWHGPAGIDVWGSASYGKHLENGGYIFYPVFYELMARTQYEGAQSTTNRLRDIAKVYEYNRLKSDVAATGSTNWLEGLLKEFPESGLVSTTFLYSLLGISSEYDGLHIDPAFNDVYEFMGVKDLMFGKKSYNVQVNRDGSCVITACDGVIDIPVHYTPTRFGNMSYTISVFNTNGTTDTYTVVPDQNGTIHYDFNKNNVACVEIAPNLK